MNNKYMFITMQKILRVIRDIVIADIHNPNDSGI